MSVFFFKHLFQNKHNTPISFPVYTYVCLSKRRPTMDYYGNLNQLQH